jgi:hypothetical protein
MADREFIEKQRAIGRRIEAMEKMIADWGQATVDNMLRQLASMGLEDKLVLINKLERKRRKSLMRSLKTKLKLKDGELDRISFSFIKHGIFLEHGVGHRRPKGVNNNPHPWLKPNLDPAIEQLADMLAEQYADLAAEELKFSIPGIISTKIKVG